MALWNVRTWSAAGVPQSLSRPGPPTPLWICAAVVGRVRTCVVPTRDHGTPTITRDRGRRSRPTGRPRANGAPDHRPARARSHQESLPPLSASNAAHKRSTACNTQIRTASRGAPIRAAISRCVSSP